MDPAGLLAGSPVVVSMRLVYDFDPCGDDYVVCEFMDKNGDPRRVEVPVFHLGTIPGPRAN